MTIPLSWVLALSAVVFGIGVIGLLTRRNILILFMSLELILNAANINLVAFSHYLHSMRGNVIVVFTIAVAAAEAAVGLAILLSLFRNRRTVNLDEVREMKG